MLPCTIEVGNSFQLGIVALESKLYMATSLAWPDRFFLFLFVVAEKRVWSGLHTHLVLTPLEVLNKLRHQHLKPRNMANLFYYLNNFLS